MPSAGEKQQNDPSALNSHEKPGCYSSEAGSSKLSCPAHDGRRPHRPSQHIPQARIEIRRSPNLLPTLSGVSASAEGRGQEAPRPNYLHQLATLSTPETSPDCILPQTGYANEPPSVTSLWIVTDWFANANHRYPQRNNHRNRLPTTNNQLSTGRNSERATHRNHPVRGPSGHIQYSRLLENIW